VKYLKYRLCPQALPTQGFPLLDCFITFNNQHGVTTMDNNKDKLFSDMKIVLSDAEDLLKAAASSSGERAVELREKAMVSLRRAKEVMQDAQSAVVEKGKAAARATDDYVHDNPWKAVGIAAAVGFVLGLIVNRR
jgi:ElaB/YqjD/DUF883 family membrane-anchored ribosome-binding protein